MKRKMVIFLSFVLTVFVLCSCTAATDLDTSGESESEQENNATYVTYTYCNMQFAYNDEYKIQDTSAGYRGVTLQFDDQTFFILAGSELNSEFDESDWEALYREAHESMVQSMAITETGDEMKTFLGKPALFVTGTREKLDTGDIYQVEMIYFMLDSYIYSLQYYSQDLELYRNEYESIISTISINPEYQPDLSSNQPVEEAASPSAPVNSEARNSKLYELGSLQLELHSDIIWDTLSDEYYSDLEKVQLFRLPVTVTNTSAEDLPVSVEDFVLYGPTGTKLDDLGVYYDNDAGYILNVEAGKSVEAYFTFQYDGSGEYLIAFDMDAGKLDIKFTMPD